MTLGGRKMILSLFPSRTLVRLIIVLRCFFSTWNLWFCHLFFPGGIYNEATTNFWLLRNCIASKGRHTNTHMLQPANIHWPYVASSETISRTNSDMLSYDTNFQMRCLLAIGQSASQPVSMNLLLFRCYCFSVIDGCCRNFCCLYLL